ncbi:uncharacterized protein LOC121381130 [Gigantopelta aegis]|uniref:uncharacterized protein LOC121381130 n=1 Tax=Gigantopelta aegis TaxID=1735272 RepID=UPI001B88745F|nr:uncharacterized protein LOC121381130 [Gigantopelta aegis]XP_041366202.1 uncharacterized protein LOC121381130 [Gigantopelta aegis]XP_041366203.1 uncharacterized protein LOC121381130 [Gigantopelta aegis]
MTTAPSSDTPQMTTTPSSDTPQMTTALSSDTPQVLFMPPDHLPYSIVSLLFFFPLGVVAVLEAFKVRNAVKLNDVTLARQASDKAAKYAMASILVGTNVMMAATCIVLCVFYQS